MIPPMADSDYLLFGVVALAAWWFFASIAVMYAAEARGRGTAWFWLSIVVSPILAAILLIAYPVKDVVEKAVAGDGLGLQHDSSWSPGGKEPTK
jgi:hypothetical protein